MSVYAKICDAIERFSNWLIALFILAIILITLVSVLYRYFLNSPITWSEQIPRIFFIWTTFLGAASLYRKVEHINFDYFLNKMPRVLRKIIIPLNEIAVLALFLVYLYFGLKLTFDNVHQTYGSLQLSPSLYYLACPLSALIMVIYWVELNLLPLLSRPKSTMDLGEQ
jgi:TRAP-type C4-dicarboxylate transport system permease small subunit